MFPQLLDEKRNKILNTGVSYFTFIIRVALLNFDAHARQCQVEKWCLGQQEKIMDGRVGKIMWIWRQRGTIGRPEKRWRTERRRYHGYTTSRVFMN